MTKEVIQDEVHLNLNEEITVVHETVKVTVNVQAQIDPKATTEDAFRAEVRETLSKFIDADWKITSLTRSSEGRYERVYVQASARVPEKENSRLEERANEVSRIGFELQAPYVDFTLPTNIVEETNESLRVKLAEKAKAEAARYTKLFGPFSGGDRGYRVAQLVYQRSGSNLAGQNNTRAVAKSFAAAPMALEAAAGAVSYGGQDEMDNEGGESFNVSTKFTMNASLVLRRLVATN